MEVGRPATGSYPDAQIVSTHMYAQSTCTEITTGDRIHVPSCTTHPRGMDYLLKGSGGIYIQMLRLTFVLNKIYLDIDNKIYCLLFGLLWFCHFGSCLNSAHSLYVGTQTAWWETIALSNNLLSGRLHYHTLIYRAATVALLHLQCTSCSPASGYGSGLRHWLPPSRTVVLTSLRN